MSRIRFPERRPDGSFSVEIIFGLKGAPGSDLSIRVADHLRAWTVTNAVWRREWSDGRVENLRFEDEFFGAPCPVRIDATGMFAVRLDAKPTAKWWKDWIVLRVVKELREAFPELGDVGSIKGVD